MNCDEAFDHMTDTNLRHRPALKQHVERCPRCRQMQETLQPALALFSRDAEGDDVVSSYPNSIHTSSGNYSNTSFPDSVWSQEFLSPEAVEAAEHAAMRLATGSSVRSPRFWQFSACALRYAAVLVVGAVIGWGVWTPHGPAADLPSGAASPVAGAAACTRNPEHSTKASQQRRDSKSVVLSCVACHLASR